MAAVNLARLAKTPLRILIVNKGSPPGRGVAYSTRQPEHLLNVAARNMSAFADQPNHFIDWLGTRSEYADVPQSSLRESFIPRKTYGDYLQALLQWHMKGMANSSVQIELVDGEAQDLVPGPENVAVVVGGLPTIETDKVLLATGNPPPADLPWAGAYDHPRLVRNPWKYVDFREADSRQDVVLVGAGLTMVDQFLTLSSHQWRGTVFAVSRSGLLPQSHFHGISYPEFPPADPSTLGLDALSELIEDHCTQLRRRGENPAIVIDKLRPYTQRIWQNLPVEEKRRFLREYRTRWNVIRHRVAHTIHDQMASAIKAGTLKVLEGQIEGMSNSTDCVSLTLAMKRGERTTLHAGWVINCTGPMESYKNSNSALYRNLMDRGAIQADELDLGLKVGSDFRVIDQGGYTSEYLFAVGPMLKGTLWETTAVPELRLQALRVAEKMIASFEGGAAPGWFAEMWVDVVEYAI
jgi:uncharacterized NAD(P)/FAD-binding protein YdhS